MKMQKTVVRCLATLLLCGAYWVPGLASSPAVAAPGQADLKPAEITSIKGTCIFRGRTSTWSAKLKSRGNGTYDAVYVSSWGGSPLSYVGTIKTDLKTEISGSGKASGGSGRANGTFEFSGKYDTNGIAQCSYKEVGGPRSGSMTAELPR